MILLQASTVGPAAASPQPAVESSLLRLCQDFRAGLEFAVSLLTGLDSVSMLEKFLQPEFLQ